MSTVSVIRPLALSTELALSTDMRTEIAQGKRVARHPQPQPICLMDRSEKAVIGKSDSATHSRRLCRGQRSESLRCATEDKLPGRGEGAAVRPISDMPGPRLLAQHFPADETQDSFRIITQKRAQVAQRHTPLSLPSAFHRLPEEWLAAGHEVMSKAGPERGLSLAMSANPGPLAPVHP